MQTSRRGLSPGYQCLLVLVIAAVLYLFLRSINVRSFLLQIVSAAERHQLTETLVVGLYLLLAMPFVCYCSRVRHIESTEEQNRQELKTMTMQALQAEIHSRQEAETSLQNSLHIIQKQWQEMTTLYNTAPVGLAYFDQAYRIVRMNDRMASLFGLPATALVGKTIHQLLPHLLNELLPTIQVVFDSGQALEGIEARAAAPRDLTKPLDWIISFYPVKNSQAMVQGIQCVALEVTHLPGYQKLRENALNHSAVDKPTATS